MALRLLVALLLASGTACSLATNLDDLSKDFGKDAAADARDGARSDTPVSGGDARDGGGDGTVAADGSTDVGTDGGGDATGDRSSDDSDGGGDAGGSDGGGTEAGGADGGGDGGKTCPGASPQGDSTLELFGAPPATTGCGIVTANLPAYYVATDPTTFAASASCGACVRIETGKGMVEATIVDLGPERFSADRATFVVNQAALDILLPAGSTFLSEGAAWSYVACSSASTGMSFTIKDGSSTSYAAVLVQNHRYRIANVEYKSGANFKPLTRTTYNYWESTTGMGTGPFTLRLTDVNGATVEQSGIPLSPGVLFHGTAQFPICM